VTAVVALDVPRGPGFVAALRRVWDRGDAALPVDQRLPRAARAELLATLAASSVIGPDGNEVALPDGRPGTPGDALVVATSGTTGVAKGVVLDHAAVAAHAHAVHTRLAVDPATDRWLACLPLSHVGGLGVVTRALVTGTALEVVADATATTIDEAARSGATLVSLVPTVLDRVDATGFRWIVVGAAHDPRPRPGNVVHTYGMTESGGGVVYDGIPLDGVEMRVVDGEIQLRSPTLLRAYRDGTDPRTADGWYPTGDLGSLDAEGVLHVDGRREELIITGGENVWPGAVEALLREAPGVADVAVVGRDDPEWGQRVVAVVEAADPATAPQLDELRALVEQRLPPFAAPRELIVVHTLPRTALGKIRRDTLLG
jgi:O-succinylbenzoic acid--CoA ligase